MHNKIISLFALCFSITLSSFSADSKDSEFEKSLLNIINDYRISQNLSLLSYDKQLYLLAYNHCCYMQKKEKLSHDHFKKRFKESGYKLCVENVGFFSNQTPLKQLNGWKNSERHNQNLLNPEIRYGAIAKSGDYVCFIGSGNPEKS